MSRKIHTDNSTIVWQISNQSLVKLDIGGTVFKCYRETLYSFPESKLARLQEDDLVLETSTDRNEYFFDRNPVFFNIILDAYRKGVVHLQKDICGLDFKKELDFWEISPGHVAPCCWEAYYRGQSEEDTMTRLMENYRENTNIWAVFMSFIVVISTVLLCIATLPIAFDKSSEEDDKILQRMVDIFGFKNQTGKKLKDLKWNDAFLTTEYSYNEKMNNAFSAMYWALITMTTVGYGNYVPETVLGHVIACACAVCGVIILALPIGVISSNFYRFYNYHKYAERRLTEYGAHLKGKVYPYHSKRSTTAM
ncbi:potassium voltage-gated channel subfamily B member 1-like [Mya arenaria]|uniref:potassium voltage-gated channel subfamily B member 1-like n=1 Tax=Mya arenaria TaxID=6604 RepID=UPI0022E7121A|nr:potassium voltage-gated channel subfamily B member 1-like [Mya arenaria]